MSQVATSTRTSVGHGMASVVPFIPAAICSVLLALASLPQLLEAKIADGMYLLGFQFITLDNFRALGGDTRYWIYLPTLLLFLAAWHWALRKNPTPKAIGFATASACAIAALLLFSVSYTSADLAGRSTGLGALPFVAFGFLLIPCLSVGVSDTWGRLRLVGTTFVSAIALGLLVILLLEERPSPSNLSQAAYAFSEIALATLVVGVVALYNAFAQTQMFQKGSVQALTMLGLLIAASIAMYAMFTASAGATSTEIGMSIVFANLMWANWLVLFGGVADFAFIGVLGLIACVVPLNVAFSYLRGGGQLGDWKWFGLAFLALVPVLPIPIYWEVAFFFGPFNSLVIAATAILLLKLALRGRSDQLEIPENQGGLLRTGIVAAVCFFIVSVSLYLFLSVYFEGEHDARSTILVTSILGLLYAAFVFRNVRKKPEWSWSYVVQAFAMATVLPLAIWSNDLVHASHLFAEPLALLC